MGQKQDVLEQIAEDWLQLRGYFTVHDVPFKPTKGVSGHDRNLHSVASDIDILAVHPNPPPDKPRAYAVSCKSGGGAFDASKLIAAIESDAKWWGKTARKHFRELAVPLWRDAFLDTVKTRCGVANTGDHGQFRYMLVVGSIVEGTDRDLHKRFSKELGGAHLEVKTFKGLLEEVWSEVAGGRRAASDVGRLLQLVKQSGWSPPPVPARPVARRGPNCSR